MPGSSKSTVAGRKDRPDFFGRAAICGVGYTELSKDSGRTVIDLAAEAGRAALADAGIEAAEVDGVVSYSLFGDSVGGQAVASALALPELTYAVDLTLGGQAASFAVINAALAIASGLASNVLVYRALNGRSGIRIGTARTPAPTAQYRYPLGYSAYPYYMAMLARRFMIETGADSDDLGAVAVAQRKFAVLNERAIQRKPLTIEDYHASPWLVEPFHIADCTSEVDGACAVLVSSLPRARASARPPVVIEGGAWATGHRSGLDTADLLLWPDYATICQHVLAPRLWRSAGMTPADIDLAELYDCFTSPVLFALEGLGLVDRGESGSFIRDGNTALDGSLPLNTHGGLLGEGYVHGMNTLTEGVLQLQGRGGNRQVADAATCLVTSGAMGDGSAVILKRDGA